MSVRTEKAAPAGVTPEQMAAAISESMPANAELAEGAGTFSTASPDSPLTRYVHVSIRASLNDLCLQRQKGTWSPSAEALRSIFQQKRFTALDGSADPQGDLKSIVLHSMDMVHCKSTFGLALGARISGVDDRTFSSTGEAFSTIIAPNSESTATKKLQADDVSLGAPPPCAPDAEPASAFF